MAEQSEQARLADYYPFDTAVLNAVSSVADTQRAAQPDSFIKDLPAAKVVRLQTGEMIEVLDIMSDGASDDCVVYHLPMACTLDANMVSRITTLSRTIPSTRVIVFSNTGRPGHSYGQLRPNELRSVWSGDFRAIVSPALEYLREQGITRASHVGFSYGADRAAAAAIYAAEYSLTVPHLVCMEPVSVKRRGLIGLVRAFMPTAQGIPGYVRAARTPGYDAARRLAENRSYSLLYAIGLLRATNISIAHALSQDGFAGRIRAAVTSQSAMKTMIIWGSASELASPKQLRKVVEVLSQEYGTDRVRSFELANQKHAMGEDIYLHAALVLQALKR